MRISDWSSDVCSSDLMVLDESERNFSVLPSQLFREGIEEGSPGGAAIRKEVADLIEKSKRDEFYALGIVLGFRCCSSPIIAYDGTEATWTISRDYVPCASPGSLAPHAWLPDGGSLYDLFGDGYRSEEHTSELQSLMRKSYAVFCLKKKKHK